MSKIIKVHARQVFDSRGNPTIEAEVVLDNKIKTNNKVAKAQVLLSKKSVVFFTPPICCELPPPKEEPKPPPFGFCTIITTTNKNATITIRIKNIENVLITIYYFVFVFFLLLEFGLQRNHFFLDISNLKFCKIE